MLVVFLLCPPFQDGRKMLGDKAQTFHKLPFSLLLASDCFPRCFFCFLLLFVGCTATGAKNKFLPHASIKRLEKM